MMNSRGFEFRLVLVKEYIRESLEDGQVGGKWAADGTYNSGETRCCRIDFEEPTFRMLDSSFLGSIVQLMFILSIYGLEHPATPIALLIFFDRHHGFLSSSLFMSPSWKQFFLVLCLKLFFFGGLLLSITI
ncbi:hypothetical protein Bca4012_089757 [Brassica carinata]